MEHSHQRVVVAGIDGSPESLVAARYALWQAALRGLAVRLVCSYPTPLMDVPAGGDFSEDFRSAGQTILDDALAALDVPSTTRVSTEVAEMMPAVLMERSSQPAALMVVGQHAVAWYDRLGRGSVASPLAQRSGCPVVVVPPSWRAGGQERRPVVVALDGEDVDRAALELAFDEAELLGTEVVALYALAGRSTMESDTAERNVAWILTGVAAGHLGTRSRVAVVSGDPQRVIFTAAQSAALLVVGSPRTEGLAVWSRSMARRIMLVVECPLVIAPGRHRSSQTARPEVLVAS
jgi:nucleotide-binding universal stress UspA family protein